MMTSFGRMGWICLLLFWGCVPQPAKEPSVESRYEKFTLSEWPALQDDMNLELLKPAIEKSLEFYQKVPGDRTYTLGDLQIPANVLKETLTLFLDHLARGRLDPKSLSGSFDLYGLRPAPGKTEALVTGYYEPVLDGRLTPDAEYNYPLYALPQDLVAIDPAAFAADKFSGGERWVGRLHENRVVPYFTRAEIDSQRKLDHCRCQLAWLKDPVDGFFLHIQGSGVIRLPQGTFRRIGYSGANGRPYRSVGKVLIDRGLMAAEGISMQAIRDFLKAHPELQDEMLGQNESYVFFRWVEKGPVGSLNVVLTDGRSAAMDPKYQPKGGLAFIITKQPQLARNGEVTGTIPLSRWVLSQDTGGAIKGPGRMDLFCGTGEPAEWMAGHMKYPGRLYFLLKRQEP
jgi:membrane-bound lytic murein transglycosylase A